MIVSLVDGTTSHFFAAEGRWQCLAPWATDGQRTPTPLIGDHDQRAAEPPNIATTKRRDVDPNDV